MGSDGAEVVSPSAGVGDDTGSGQWAPHGPQLTAGLVALNVFLVMLVYMYFWRFFSRKSDGDGGVGGAGARSGGDDDDVESSSSAAASPPAVSPKARDRQAMEPAITALPVFVVDVRAGAASSSSESDSGGGMDDGDAAKNGGKVECAICIAEFADGEEGRLLPRCGHRFHARCVDMWFQFHSTCPLCRAGVLPPSTASQSQDGGELTPPDTNTDCAV